MNAIRFAIPFVAHALDDTAPLLAECVHRKDQVEITGDRCPWLRKHRSKGGSLKPPSIAHRSSSKMHFLVEVTMLLQGTLLQRLFGLRIDISHVRADMRSSLCRRGGK